MVLVNVILHPQIDKLLILYLELFIIKYKIYMYFIMLDFYTAIQKNIIY